MRPNVILRYCGLSLVVVSTLMLVSAIIAFFNESDCSFIPLLISGLFFMAGGLLLVFLIAPVRGIYTGEGYTIVFTTWMTACIAGAIPFVIYGGEFTVVNALFESVSGFTTTGASILNNIEALPMGLLFWRVAEAWIGGIGVVILITLAISDNRSGQSVLVSSETSNLSREYFTGNKRRFVKMMILTYSSITLLSFILLMITGMGWFDALTHAMSACSTCGFSTKNSSIAYFDSPLIEAVLIFSMLSGAVNFTLLYSTIVPGRHKRSYILKSEIFRAFLILIAVAVVMNTISLRINNEYSSLSETFRQAVFQTVSLATTTGFATTDTNVWPGFCIGVLIFSSLICGCAGSTSGGIKVDRLVLVAKGTHYQIQRLKKPSQVIHSRLEGKFRKPDEIVQAEIFILLYLGLIFIGATLNLALGMDPRSGISAAIACMGNVGPGFGEVGSIGNYSDLPDTLKISNTILMLAGRLEIYPIVLAFRNRI